MNDLEGSIDRKAPYSDSIKTSPVFSPLFRSSRTEHNRVLFRCSQDDLFASTTATRDVCYETAQQNPKQILIEASSSLAAVVSQSRIRLLASFLAALVGFPQRGWTLSATSVWKTTRQTILRKQFWKGFVAVFLTLQFTQWLQVKSRQRVDATSEWERYAQYPGARGRALFSLLLAQILPLYVLAKVTRGALQNKILKYGGNVLSDGLLQLGPLYIKLGQIISSRENILPDSWYRALERLQDQVPARSGARAMDLAYAAWSGDQDSFDATFTDFDTTPLAAASLGQVHLARYGNDTVAIKLQRPYLRQIYDQDFVLLTKVASIVDSFAGSAGVVGGIEQSWTQIFADAEDILYREIDYRDEADNGIRFCDDFGLALGGRVKDSSAKSQDGQLLPSAASWLRAPHVYGDLCSEKFLVMEFVESIKITSQTKLNEQGVTSADREYLADCLARAYLRQFCCNLFFSTDPHPGNLGVEVLNRDGSRPEERVRLVFYDFGQAAKLQPEQAQGILDVMEAIVDMDVDKSVRAFQQMGVLKDTADLDMVRAKVADNFRTGKVKANRQKLKRGGYKFQPPVPGNAKNVTTTSNTTTKDSEIMKFFTLPAEYAFVARALSQMDGVGKTLAADFDFVSSGAPWIYEIKGAQRYLRDEAQKWFEGVLGMDGSDGTVWWQRILPTYVDSDERERKREERNRRRSRRKRPGRGND